MTPATPIGVREIFSRLPHRQPMLMVDRVEELHPPERLVAIKNVTINEDFFRGHFPGNPIMPGVLIVEAMAQACGLLVSYSLEAEAPAMLPYLAGVERVKFRRPVVPGDRLMLDVSLMNRRGVFWKFRCLALVDGQRASEADILLSLQRRHAQEEESTP